MFFNFGKCKCLHTGPGNTGMKYELGPISFLEYINDLEEGVTGKLFKFADYTKQLRKI